MNSDSYFDSDFFNENKTMITIVTSLSIVFISFYYIYKSLNLNEGAENNNEIYPDRRNTNINSNSQAIINTGNIIQNIGINIPKLSNKKKLMINGSTVLIKDLNDIDRPLIYQFLDPLSKDYDLYIVFLVENEKEIKIITDNLQCLVDDKIVFKHVKFKFINLFNLR
jgi:hypothetical protein